MDDIVPALVVLIVIGGPIAAWIIHRVLAHQERLEMIRNGFPPPFKGAMPPPPPGAAQGYPPPFRGGYAGAVPPPQFGDPQYQAQLQLRRGVTVTMIGFAITLGLSFIGGMHHPGPWLLGGLIPMFVGIAQVVNAYLNGARFPVANAADPNRFGPGAAPGPRAAEPPPYTPPSGPPPAPPTPDSYGAWRPGNTTGIPKPPSPPDRV